MDVHFGPRTEVTEDRSDQGPKWMYPLVGVTLSNFAEIFGVGKLESLRYRVVLFV